VSEVRSLVACLSPAGRSALATLGLCGPRAWAAVRELFVPRRGALPETLEEGRFWLGRLGDTAADEGVLAVRHAGPVPCVEVHVHGGREVVRWLTELFVERGLTVCGWEEYLQETGLLEALIAAHLARTSTVRTAGIVLEQRSALPELLRRLRVHLDSGEQEAYEARLTELRRWARLGEHLSRPWRVVLAGAPNVGKSSLLNALAGYQRSIVAATPGTTRDVVTAILAIDGWPVEVCDTAGVRLVDETLEGQGIEQARDAAATADLCLWLLDASCEPVWPAEGAGNVRLVVNKVDRPAAWELERADGAVRVSATTGQGLDELCAAVSRWLVPEVPPAGTAVPLPGLEALLADRRHLGG
jgi:tRNA modification GTPase